MQNIWINIWINKNVSVVEYLHLFRLEIALFVHDTEIIITLKEFSIQWYVKTKRFEKH